MKRIIAVLLLLSLLLVGCKSTSGVSNPNNNLNHNQQVGNNVQNDQDQTADEDQPDTPSTYRHPLTGAVLRQPWSGQITAVMIDNLWNALPQHGLTHANILYEAEVENGVTSFLAVYSDLSKVSMVGPIAKTRTVFNSIALSYDAVLIHSGGSTLALEGRYDSSADTIINWKHIDEVTAREYFYRDEQRRNEGYTYAHTLFASGMSLRQGLSETKLDAAAGKGFGLQFVDATSDSGKKADSITITFKSNKSTSFAYDISTGKYKMSQIGKDTVDGNTGTTLSFENVIALYTDQTRSTDGTHEFFETIGSGEGYLAMNGKIIPILWSRESLRSPFTYTNGDGTPISLSVGNSYMAIVGTKTPISYK